MECFKIVFGLFHLNLEEYFEFAKVSSTRTDQCDVKNSLYRSESIVLNIVFSFK